MSDKGFTVASTAVVTACSVVLCSWGVSVNPSSWWAMSFLAFAVLVLAGMAYLAGRLDESRARRRAAEEGGRLLEASE